MEERVATHAHHLRAVPVEEGSGGLADLRRMRYAADANGASLALILKNPAQAEETHCKC